MRALKWKSSETLDIPPEENRIFDSSARVRWVSLSTARFWPELPQLTLKPAVVRVGFMAGISRG